VQGYKISEMPFDGSPTILDVSVIEESNERVEIQINTNAGYRSFSYLTVNIEWPCKYKNVIEEQFYSKKRDELVKFLLNDYIQINTGKHAGSTGSVISIKAEKLVPNYIVELETGEGDVCISQLLLSLKEGSEINET
jgi:ribosomal protein S4E